MKKFDAMVCLQFGGLDSALGLRTFLSLDSVFVLKIFKDKHFLSHVSPGHIELRANN